MKKRMMAIALMMMTTLGACTINPGGAGNIPEENGRQVSEVREDLPVQMSGNATELTGEIQTIKAPESEISEEQISALSVAGTKLFAQTVANEGEDKNILLSPVSVALAFGMAENGAGGNTLTQIENTINGGSSIDEMNPLLSSLSQRMSSSQDAKWNVANSIWFKEDGTWEILPDFASKAKSWYGADLWGAPFDDSTVRDINNWVNNETKGMIPEILDRIPDDARMYLINALAFEAEWQNEYKETDILEEQDFNNADGSKTSVTMLFSNEGRYFTLNGGTGFIRDYKGGEYSFMGLLPEEGTDLDAYIAELANSDADISAAIRNIQYGDVIVEIPEFTNDYDVEMSEILKDLGMTDAFDGNTADFYGMMKPLSDDEYAIWINRVLHKTHIEVDREGTRAAAVTAIEMECETACETVIQEPIRVILDRPFIYGIIDNETGLPVFLGCVNRM